MWRLADQQLDEFVADGRCEFISAYTQPFAMLVGRRPARRARGGPPAVPRGLRPERHRPATVGAGEEGSVGREPARVARRVVRRATSRTAGASPATDVLTDLALATYPDGTTPDVTSVVRTSTFLFAAGQETTARLLAAALKHLAEHPELQDELRADRERDPRLPRGGAAHREPGEDRLPPRRSARRPSAASTSRPARRSCCSTAPPTATPGGSSARTSSGSTAPTPRPTSPSVAASTPARAARSPAPRAGSASSASSTGCANIRLSEEHHGPPGDRRFQLRADVGPPRPHEAPPRVRRRRGRPMSRVAVVTGGASGIGLGVARRFVADGHRRRHPRPGRRGRRGRRR